jgi:hypothetical protein
VKRFEEWLIILCFLGLAAGAVWSGFGEDVEALFGGPHSAAPSSPLLGTK